MTKQEHDIEDTRKEMVYVPNVRMEEVPAELLDDASAENPTEGLEEDSTVSPQAAAEWRITSAADWEALLSGAKSSDWSDGSYTGEDDVTIILEADIVTARDSIYLTKENITFTLDLNKHSLQSSAGIIHVNSTNDTGGKRIENSFVLCNGKIVNTCIDTSNAMENVDIHGVDFTNMRAGAVQSSSSTGCKIQDCSFSHVNGTNADTAIVAAYSGSVQIYRVSIDGFRKGIDCTYSGSDVKNITVSGAEIGIDLSFSSNSTITDSTLGGNKAEGSRGIVCDGVMNSVNALFEDLFGITRVNISDFDSGIRISTGELALDKCKITNVNRGLDSRSEAGSDGTAHFTIRDSILAANKSVTEGSYGIYAPLGYICINTEVKGFKVGSFNSSATAAIANCTFDNLDCNVRAASGVVYNSILKNADIGFETYSVATAYIVDTEVSGKNTSGSIGIWESQANGTLVALDTAFVSPDSLNNPTLNTLVAYVESAQLQAPQYDMLVSAYDTGLQCDGNQIQIGDIEVKDCGTGIKGTACHGIQGANEISDNYIHDCEIGVECNSLFLKSNMYIYNCSQTGMKIHQQLSDPRLLEIYHCGDGLVFDGTLLTNGPHLRIHDNTGDGFSYTGSSPATVRATMEIYNNGGWNVLGDDINMFQLIFDSSNEFTCRLENGGLGNMNIKSRNSAGGMYMLNVSLLKSDESIYYVYPQKELYISPQGNASWTGPTDWLQGSMVFDTENYAEGAAAAYVQQPYIRTTADTQNNTWDFVRTHFFAAKEGWIIQYDMNATPVMGGYPLVFTEGCNVTYDYKTNGGTSIQSDYEKITYLEGEAVDLSITASRPGYEFLGWSTSPDAHKPVSALTAGKKNITLYAVYRKAVTFTYHTYDSSLDYTQDGYIFNREKVPYEDLGGSQALRVLSYAEQVPESAYVYAGYSFDGRNKTDLFRDGAIPSSEQTDIYCVYIINGVLSYLKPDGAVDHQQTVEAFYTILDSLPYQFSYVLHSFRPEKGYVFSGWRDAAGGLYAPGSTYVTTQNPAELQAEIRPLLVSSLVVSPKHSTVSIGETIQLRADIQPEDVLDPTVTWTTSDASIATVDANGLVTAHG
ncbi:MAG: InlB B-repeat-containing protein, partial [Lachnospiraceae bacterium]|nr:InlB B-repeat-containing protein [Lachnospiraceae bacterium]